VHWHSLMLFHMLLVKSIFRIMSAKNCKNTLKLYYSGKTVDAFFQTQCQCQEMKNSIRTEYYVYNMLITYYNCLNTTHNILNHLFPSMLYLAFHPSHNTHIFRTIVIFPFFKNDPNLPQNSCPFSFKPLIYQIIPNWTHFLSLLAVYHH